MNKTHKSQQDNKQVQSLTRGLLLLEKIAENPFGISLTELALQLGLPNSTVHRLLMTMQQQGFIQQEGELSLWKISAKTFKIGNAFAKSRDLITLAQPVMQNLMDNAGETVNLLLLDQIQFQPIVIGQIQCHELMRMVAPIGKHLPLHASGAGKAFLAMHDDDQVTAIVQRKGLIKFTDHTITQHKDLLDNLEKVRQHGYALDDEEHAIGMRCVAAVIVDEHQKAFAALSISGPASRLDNEKIVHLSSLVMQSSQKISHMYGG